MVGICGWPGGFAPVPPIAWDSVGGFTAMLEEIMHMIPTLNIFTCMILLMRGYVPRDDAEIAVSRCRKGFADWLLD